MFHPSCIPCSKSELDLFSVPDTQTDIIDSVFNEIHPISTLSGDEAPLEFYIPGAGELFLDPSSIKLFVKLKIVKDDGSPLDANSKVFGENYLLGSLFSSLDLIVNDMIITTPCYAYRAYLETILNYSGEAKTSFLKTGGYFESSEALKNNYMAQDVISLYGKVHADLLNTERLLPNHVSLKFRFMRSSNGFALNTYGGDTNSYKISIIETYMTVRRVRLNAASQMRIEKRFLTETAKYPLNRILCRQFTINNGLMNRRIDNISLGPLPSYVILGLVTHSGFSGTHGSSGLKFANFNLKHVDVLVNGVSTSRRQKVNYEAGNEDYSYAYYKLHQLMNENDGSSSISYTKYEESMNLYGFNLTPDYALPSSSYVSPIKQGSLSIDLEFAKPLASTVSLIILLDFLAIVEIDKSRNLFGLNI